MSENQNNKPIEPWAVIVVFIGIIVWGAVIIDFVPKVFNKGKDALSGNSYKKEMCINQTRNIKNEFTAKKLYKQCMKR